MDEPLPLTQPHLSGHADEDGDNRISEQEYRKVLHTPEAKWGLQRRKENRFSNCVEATHVLART